MTLADFPLAAHQARTCHVSERSMVPPQRRSSPHEFTALEGDAREFRNAVNASSSPYAAQGLPSAVPGEARARSATTWYGSRTSCRELGEGAWRG